jgi:sugar (pentulose or hexulose) kinase
MIAVGGAARNDVWMQIKADVCGARLVSPAIDEGAALGAALAVALGCDALDLAAVVDIAQRLQEAGREFLPNGPRHDLYCALYQQGFMALQEPLRRVSRSVARVERDA